MITHVFCSHGNIHVLKAKGVHIIEELVDKSAKCITL